MITQLVAERRASVINPLHPRDPALAELFGVGRESASGEAVTPASSLRVNAFMAGVNYLARTIASLPLDVYQRMEPRGRRKAREHRLWEPLHSRPNRFQTSFEFRMMLMHHVVLRGNFYAQLSGDGQMLPLHPDRVRPFWAPDGSRAYGYQPENGPERVFVQGEVFHVMYMPADGLMGRSVIEYQVETLGRALAEGKYAATLQRVGTRLSGVLKVKKRLSAEAKLSLRRQWQERNAGVGNAGSTAILEEDMDWTPVSMTNVDAQAVEMMELGREDMAIMLNIPPHKVGANRRSTFSNIEHQAIEAVQDGLRPWCVNIEQVGNEVLFTPGERSRGFYMEFNLDGLLRGDFLSRQQGLEVQRRNGIISGDDWADVENMNPFEGGDLRFMPLNMAPLEQLASRQVDEVGAAGAQTQGRTTWPYIRRFPWQPGERRSVEMMGRLRSAYGPVLLDASRRLMRRETDAVERQFRRQAQDGSLAEFVAWVDAYYGEFREVIGQTLGPSVGALAETIAVEAHAMVASDETPDVQDFVSSYVGGLASRHASASRGALLALVGEDAAAVLRSATALFHAWRSERPGRMAAGEAVRVSNAVCRQVWLLAGVEQVRWLRSESCEACGERSGQVVRLNESFAGDIQHPPAVEGCDCMLVPA